MGSRLPPKSTDEEEKKSVPRVPETDRFTLGDYIHGLGIDTDRIFIVDRSSGHITSLVKKILNEKPAKES